jgi:hypothetical protein
MVTFPIWYRFETFSNRIMIVTSPSTTFFHCADFSKFPGRERPTKVWFGSMVLVQEVQFGGTDHGLHPAAHVELVEDVVDMPFDRADRHDKLIGDLLVG